MESILNKKGTKTENGLINEGEAIFSYGKTQARKKGIKKKNIEKTVDKVRRDS